MSVADWTIDRLAGQTPGIGQRASPSPVVARWRIRNPTMLSLIRYRIQAKLMMWLIGATLMFADDAAMLALMFCY